MNKERQRVWRDAQRQRKRQRKEFMMNRMKFGTACAASGSALTLVGTGHIFVAGAMVIGGAVWAAKRAFA